MQQADIILADVYVYKISVCHPSVPGNSLPLSNTQNAIPMKRQKYSK